MKEKILLSFIIPVYNARCYLEECVNSIVNQDNGMIEVVLVDDGSTDDSLSICESLHARFPETVYAYHQKNQGSMAARLNGVKKSSGEYLQFVDADDYLVPGAVEHICKDTESRADIYLYDEITQKSIGGETERFSPFGIDHRLLYNQQNRSELFCVFMESKLNSVCGCSYKKELFNSLDFLIELPKIKNGEDRLLKMFLLMNAKTVEYIPYGYYFYRYTPGSQGGALRNGILTEEGFRDFQITWPIERAHYADMQFSPEQANYYESVKLGWLLTLLEESYRETSKENEDCMKLLRLVSADRMFSEMTSKEIRGRLRKHYYITASLLKRKQIYILCRYWKCGDMMRKLKRVL